MDARAFQYLLDQNHKRRLDLLDYLGTGSAKDYAEYREVVGVLRGLLQANQNIEDLADRLKDSDND
jgi:hypothetical protein